MMAWVLTCPDSCRVSDADDVLCTVLAVAMPSYRLSQLLSVMHGMDVLVKMLW